MAFNFSMFCLLFNWPFHANSTECRSESLSTKMLDKKKKNARTHQSADLFLSVGGRARRGLDHGGRLVVCQLFDAALAGHDVADLHSVSNTASWLNRDHSGVEDKLSGSREGGRDKNLLSLTSRGR